MPFARESEISLPDICRSHDTGNFKDTLTEGEIMSLKVFQVSLQNISDINIATL
jgi:hypothetical protein